MGVTTSGRRSGYELRSGQPVWASEASDVPTGFPRPPPATTLEMHRDGPRTGADAAPTRRFEVLCPPDGRPSWLEGGAGISRRSSVEGVLVLELGRGIRLAAFTDPGTLGEGKVPAEEPTDSRHCRTGQSSPRPRRWRSRRRCHHDPR